MIWLIKITILNSKVVGFDIKYWTVTAYIEHNVQSADKMCYIYFWTSHIPTYVYLLQLKYIIYYKLCNVAQQQFPKGILCSTGKVCWKFLRMLESKPSNRYLFMRTQGNNLRFLMNMKVVLSQKGQGSPIVPTYQFQTIIENFFWKIK